MGSAAVTTTVAYEGTPIDPAELSRLQERNGARLRRLQQLIVEQTAILAEPEPERTPTMVQRLVGWLRPSVPVSDVDRLEQRIEAAQRRRLWLQHRVDAVTIEVASLRSEVEGFEVRVAVARSDARAAARAMLVVRDAIGATPDRRGMLEDRMRLRESERATHRVREARLVEILEVQRDFLVVHERLLDALVKLRDAATATADDLDRDVRRLASDARRQDFERAMRTEWTETVRRVHTATRTGKDLLQSGIDRLATELDLLAPTEPHRVAAEAEVVQALREPTLTELVERARAEVARD